MTALARLLSKDWNKLTPLERAIFLANGSRIGGDTAEKAAQQLERLKKQAKKPRAKQGE